VSLSSTFLIWDRKSRKEQLKNSTLKKETRWKSSKSWLMSHLTNNSPKSQHPIQESLRKFISKKKTFVK
jgi:hypothetical protein